MNRVEEIKASAEYKRLFSVLSAVLKKFEQDYGVDNGTIFFDEADLTMKVRVNDRQGRLWGKTVKFND